MATRWFLWFCLRVCGTHTPDFLTLPIECTCRSMVEWSQFNTFASSRVHWRWSLRINVFKRSSSNPESFPDRGVSLMSKRSSWKRENHFPDVLFPVALSPYIAQIGYFWPTSQLSPLYWTHWEKYVGNFPISPLGTPFSSVHGLHSLSSNDRISICKLKRNKWNSNKNDNP